MDHPGPWVVVTFNDGKIDQILGPFDKWSDASNRMKELSGFRQIKPLNV